MHLKRFWKATAAVATGGAAERPATERRLEKPPQRDKPEERRSVEPVAYGAVLWCACAMSLLSGGYSVQRGHALQQRLELLEEQHAALRSAVLESQQPPADRLRRAAPAPGPVWTDLPDCICAPGSKALTVYVIGIAVD
ncbi:hypothetical protein EVAR_61808_1 [Eumeta japonica]|uniref:Uncharacterized protein n=1 Tax=Eumeta variegata TaxID=151549 RepID=A0A4C1YX28_EUMVA|nr:hypothetical protein EVAR_61808_1 [Eumeta japonica]